ncbi:MAG: thiamine diphosphokinase [Paenibacillaceae bacterium]
MKLQRFLIYSGGALGAWALEDIRPDDVYVGADRGALFLVQQGIKPDISMGDFDSVDETELAFIRHNSKQMLCCDPVMKDLSDTEMAFSWALDQNPEEIILYGALGTRIDHSLANIHLLIHALQRQTHCTIVDPHNRVRLIDQSVILKRTDRFTHVSLLPFTSQVMGITLQGFQYPLHEAMLTIGQSMGISNRLVEPFGHIQIKQGMLLVIESKD